MIKDVVSFTPVNWLMVGAVRMLPVTPTIARLPVSVPEVKGRARDLEYVLVRPDRCCIAKELFWGRGHRVARAEQLALDLFVDLAAHADVVLDIGANTGVFSVVAALRNPKARVHAFEIVPEVYEVLFRNVIRNDLGARVECHFLGVGEEGFTMRVPSSASAASLPLSVASTTTLKAGESGTEVAFQSLDRVCAAVAKGARVLIKIDVEATESALFDAGWASVEQLNPRIICEILAEVPGTARLGGELRSRGFHLYNITDEGLKERESLVGVREHHDWLFSRESSAELSRLTSARII